MKHRSKTDMIDELKKRDFLIQNYDYQIFKKYSKNDLVLNTPLINIYGRKIQEYVSEILIKDLVETFKINKYKNILVAGLGNRQVLNDALGPKVIDRLLVTRGLKIQPQLSAIGPNVYAQTGIESADIIKSIVKEVKPDLVIFIDSLATVAIERLCASFQISVEGIKAGSARKNNNKTLNRKILGCDTLTIGVPMMIYAENILKEKNKGVKDIILTPCDTKKILNLISDIIADSINLSIFSKFSKKEIEVMIN